MNDRSLPPRFQGKAGVIFNKTKQRNISISGGNRRIQKQQEYFSSSYPTCTVGGRCVAICIQEVWQHKKRFAACNSLGGASPLRQPQQGLYAGLRRIQTERGGKLPLRNSHLKSFSLLQLMKFFGLDRRLPFDALQKLFPSCIQKIF